MRRLTRFEKVFGGGLLVSLTAGVALAAWAIQLGGRPVLVRNESGRAVEIAPIRATGDCLEAFLSVSKQTPVIRLANGGRTELAYDAHGLKLCGLVVFAEGVDTLVIKTPLLQRGEEIVIPSEPAPPE